MRTFLGSTFTAVRERFFDNFTRSNSASLGKATDGSSWTPVTSSLSIAGNQAVSLGSNTAYPIAAVDMPTVNNSIELTGTTQGSSAAIWVQGSNDWYMVGQDMDVTYSSFTYSYSATGYTTSTGSYPIGVWVTYSFQYYF